MHRIKQFEVAFTNLAKHLLIMIFDEVKGELEGVTDGKKWEQFQLLCLIVDQFSFLLIVNVVLELTSNTRVS